MMPGTNRSGRKAMILVRMANTTGTDTSRLRDSAGANVGLEARLTWRFDRLIYADDAETAGGNENIEPNQSGVGQSIVKKTLLPYFAETVSPCNVENCRWRPSFPTTLEPLLPVITSLKELSIPSKPF